MPKPTILISNDDGVHAPGLLALKCALEKIARVFVLAPDHNWSAAGHTKTMHKPLRVTPVSLADGSEALACTGTPSDCVSLAFMGLLPVRPDLVISGINAGSNVGHDISYSGTVAAAWEAVIAGVSGIAVSVNSYKDTDYTPAADFAAHLAHAILSSGLDRPILLNVNVPDLPREEIAGIEITRLGKRRYRDILDERRDPRGRVYYWIGGEPPTGIPQPGTDIGALADAKISVTPIQLDLTDARLMEELKQWDLNLF